MDFNLKSIRGFATEAATALSRVVQYSEEKLGFSEKTELDSRLEHLLKRVDAVKAWTEAIVYKTESVLQPNPGARVEDFIYEKLEKKKERSRVVEQLGFDMIDAAQEFGTDTQYSRALIKVGQTQQKIGQSEKEFIRASYKGFIQPLKKFLDEDMRNVMKERKVLETKRLDLDAAKKRLRKAKTVELQSNAENELKRANEEFNQQVEITKLLLEGIFSSQVNHLRFLGEFVEAQIHFFAKCHQHMCDLQRALATSDNISSPSSHLPSTVNLNLDNLTSPSDETLPPLPVGKKRARVLLDYDAQNSNELSMQANEVITVSHPSDMEPEWRLAERGVKQGRVPLAYLEILD
ncbi:SH3 domain containing GRB2 like, endophilin-B isoform X2 [Brevipalpus obovatus]|uniref:SH3 domain containing GRB2 like, endophilin-B isoform X2 n=1 Tax=Brevipalpus obovatus TaxID=246614 RepID=UPI003D9ED0AB